MVSLARQAAHASGYSPIYARPCTQCTLVTSLCFEGKNSIHDIDSVSLDLRVFGSERIRTWFKSLHPNLKSLQNRTLFSIFIDQIREK